MSTDASITTPKTIRLQEYRPPDYEIEAVSLEFDLEDSATRVRSKLRLRGSHDRAEGVRPLVLDGEDLELLSVALDGRQLGPADYVRTPRASPSRHPRQTSCSRSRRGSTRPRTRKLEGLYLSERHLLHAVRGRGLSPHHLFPRPPRRDGALHGAHRRGRTATSRCCSPTATWSRRRMLDDGRHCAAWNDPLPSRPTCSRWWRATSPRCRTLHHQVGPRGGRCASTSSPATRTAAPTRWTSLKRSMKWDEERLRPRIRSRRLQHRRRSATSTWARWRTRASTSSTTKYMLAIAGDCDRQRLRGHRARHRARVLPQLDRQPHHLPRLVPALPQGRADGLPRPGVRRRRALARRSAHPARCGSCERGSSRRMPAPSPIPCDRTATSRSTTSTRRPSTRRAPNWSA